MRYLRYLKHLIIVAFIALYCSMSSCNYLNVDDYLWIRWDMILSFRIS